MLSIITINLNNLSGLRRTIDSLRRQTTRCFQWIVIDGGSSDGSVDLIKANSDIVSHWISENDRGVYDAMNKGIALAEGEYLLFLNSGDWLSDDRVVEDFYASAFAEDVVYGNTYIVDAQGRRISEIVPPDDLSLLYFYSHNLNHQSIFFSCRCFDGQGYDLKYRICADRALVLNLLYKGYSFRHWQRYVADYDICGLSSANTQLMERESYECLNEVVPQAVLRDYDYFVQFRDVDLAIMIKRIIGSNRYLRGIARLVLKPIYGMARMSSHKKSK